ncbi:unnamed protein product [Mytilus edulis]|uniref:Uncharacterized protein n=1 Tax=Mytilus edulis TaxID=6550 RepID=A0A8S3TQX0_MYTED|nr:unnamed protein product [Mytilus edulis]
MSDNEENENISEPEEEIIPEEQAIEPQAEPAIEMAAVPPLFNIPFPGKLDLDGNISTNWKKFKRTWDNYEIASGLSTKDAKLRTATLLTCIGPEAMDIFDGLAFENEEDKKDIAKVIEKFEAFCIGKTNETFERYTFNISKMKTMTGASNNLDIGEDIKAVRSKSSFNKHKSIKHLHKSKAKEIVHTVENNALKENVQHMEKSATVVAN